MKIQIDQVRRRRWEVRIDGELAAWGKTLDMVEQQLRILTLVSDIESAHGGVTGYL